MARYARIPAALALAACWLLALAAAQIKEEPPRVFLERLKLPAGFAVELFHPGLTLTGARDIAVSQASGAKQPLIVSAPIDG